MLMIIEIILTVSAWKKGWKGWALLPLGIGMPLAFVIGIVVNASGGTTGQVAISCLILDVIAIIALGIMTSRAPEGTKESESARLTGDSAAIKS